MFLRIFILPNVEMIRAYGVGFFDLLDVWAATPSCVRDGFH